MHKYTWIYRYECIYSYSSNLSAYSGSPASPLSLYSNLHCLVRLHVCTWRIFMSSCSDDLLRMLLVILGLKLSVLCLAQLGLVAVHLFVVLRKLFSDCGMTLGNNACLATSYWQCLSFAWLLSPSWNPTRAHAWIHKTWHTYMNLIHSLKPPCAAHAHATCFTTVGFRMWLTTCLHTCHVQGYKQRNFAKSEDRRAYKRILKRFFNIERG